MAAKVSFYVEINLEKIILDFDCIALITDPSGKILLANHQAERMFPDWQDRYIFDYTYYDRAKLKSLYEKIEEKKCIFNWEIFFSGTGALVYLEITTFKFGQYYLLLATEDSTKIEYLNRITNLTGEINILNQKLSKKEQKFKHQSHIKIPESSNTTELNIENEHPQLPDLETTKKIAYSEFEICAVTRKVTVRNKNVRLTSREFELLWLMASHPNQIFTRNHLLTTIWEADYSGDDNTVTVHIRRLRKKIEDNPNKPKYIKTVWGVGYKFELPT